MSEEKRAQLLARWLDQAGDPPEDLEPDVVEAMVALRPDLAPPPRVDLDEILASVREGPLAAEPQGEVVPFPAPPEDPPRAEEAPRARVSWGRRARRWGGVGALVAVAATALFALRPVLRDEVPMAGVAPRELATEPTAQRAAPVMQEPLRDEGRAFDAGADAPAAPAPPPPPPMPAREARAPSDLATGAGRGAPAPAQKAAASAPPAMAYEAEAAPVAQEAAPAGAAWDRAGIEADEAEAAASRREDSRAYEAAASERRAAQEAASVETVTKAEKKGSWLRKRSSGADADDAGAPPTAAAPATPPPPAAPHESDPGELSRASIPHDLGGWAQGLAPEVAQPFHDALARAEAHVAAGRAADALALLESWVRPPARAGQEVARRAALLHLRQGQLDGGLAVVDRGLALSDANTPERAGLYWARGELLARAGDDDGARAAWLEALRLNRAR